MRTLEDRFFSKVNKDGPVSEHRPDLGKCWLWTGRKEPGGYGRFDMGRHGESVPKPAHAVSYEIAYGPMPPGKEPDHLCRVTSCVRPTHLEAVTHVENILRGNSPYARKSRQTHCIRGHEFTPENTSHNVVSGTRLCIACRKLWQARYRERNPDYMKNWHAARKANGDNS